MKKMIAMVMALMMCVSAAMACGCEVSPAVRLIAQQMAGMEMDLDAEDVETLSAVALGVDDGCRCEGFRALVLETLLYYEDCFTMAQRAIMRAYLIRCGCDCGAAVEDKNTETVQPVHQHKITRWVSENSTWHHGECSCGHVFEGERHKLGGVIRVEGCYEVRVCKVCRYEVYVYASVSCCGCHEGMCCENCGCGC